MASPLTNASTTRADPSDVRLPLMADATAPGDPANLTPALIRRVIDDFYAACRRDPQLAPIFAAHVADWDAHLLRIQSFWEAVLLRQSGYAGRPLEAHLDIEGLGRQHFSTWLRLFKVAVDRSCTPPQAEAFMSHAGRMANRMMAMGGMA